MFLSKPLIQVVQLCYYIKRISTSIVTAIYYCYQQAKTLK